MKNNNISILKELLVPSGRGIPTLYPYKEIVSLQDKIKNNRGKTKRSCVDKNVKRKNNLKILGMPFDTGSSIVRGQSWGPVVLKNILFAEDPSLIDSDLGDVKIIPGIIHDRYLCDSAIKKFQKNIYQKTKKNKSQILPVSPLSILEKIVEEVLFVQKLKCDNYEQQTKLLTIGGDHSITLPIIKALVAIPSLNDLAIIHLDAHTDLLDQKQGLIDTFGTWGFHALQVLQSPQHLLQIGIRESLKSKNIWKNELGVTQYWSKEIRKHGISKYIKMVEIHLKKIKSKNIYISLDLDVIDPTYFAQTGTLAPKGLFPHEITFLFSSLKDFCLKENINIVGADVVEFSPFVNHEHLRMFEGKIASYQEGLLTINAVMKHLIALLK